MALPFEASPPVSGMLKPILMASAAQTEDAAIVAARPQALTVAIRKAAPIKYLCRPHMYAYPVPAFAILNLDGAPSAHIAKEAQCVPTLQPCGNVKHTRGPCEVCFNCPSRHNRA